MTSRDIAWQRLANQQIANPVFAGPIELLHWMGCIQAQDYAGAKWAIGCRLKTTTDKTTTDAEIDALFNEGKILRTHILRPTWHFVLPGDIHWMLKLTAPKIKALCRPYHQKLGIDFNILKHSKSIMNRALGKNGKMTRDEIALLLEKEKLSTVDGRIGFLLMDAELDGLICSGGRRGKQFTYSLLEDHAPKTKPLSMKEAVAALAKRYFISRGPATLADFSWWSGLSNKEAREGIERNLKSLEQETLNGNTYWFSAEPGSGVLKSAGKSLHILPPFDEYAVGYKERKNILPPELQTITSSGLKPIIVSDGRIIGTWRRTVKKNKISIETRLPGKTAGPSTKALFQSFKRYSEFMGKDLQP